MVSEEVSSDAVWKERVDMMSKFFFFNDTATTEIYTLSLHDALPIYQRDLGFARAVGGVPGAAHASLDRGWDKDVDRDRKSTRLNSSHANISYAVFCLKKNK